MIIKNPVRITEHIGVGENIKTARGNVSGLDWCRSEAERFRRAYIPAKAVKRGDRCYVVRNVEGVVIEDEDYDLVGTDAGEDVV